MIKNQQPSIHEILDTQKLLFDGAFGTYYGKLYDTKELPELANLNEPERVKNIHHEYLEAGANVIRSNTFACNKASLQLSGIAVKTCIRAGFTIAKECAKDYDAFVAADIGPIPVECQWDREDVSGEYVSICKTFLEEGADIFLFETFSDLEMIQDAIQLIGKKAFVMVSFSVNQFGYSNSGLSARKLMEMAEQIEEIDAVGLNCGVGSGHMQQILRNIPTTGKKYRMALPNAGYPQNLSNRMIFDNQNVDYFAGKVAELAKSGMTFVGGCCGTTPEYIGRIREEMDFSIEDKASVVEAPKKTASVKKNASFFADKKDKKLIAVELAPPLGSDDEKLMDAAHLLRKSGVDVLTFPDSPSGRTRADSILMAEKVARETGMCVMPHICCRDKNAIAMRSLLLGAHINQIRNFLVITGDPIPAMVRNSIKSVFNFDSVGLMRIINDMNEEQFEEEPVFYGGAINQGRRNLEVEISRVKKKMEAGATFFLTQPISTEESAKRVRRIKEETGARILCGIMPFVSLKNATFMKNEMTGIDVSDAVLARYREDMTREEGEDAGIALAKEVMEMTKDFADGYYFSFPFNRVGMLERILEDCDCNRAGQGDD